MATQRLTMKNIREILRQKWALQRSHRDMASSLDVSAGVVGKVVGKASEADTAGGAPVHAGGARGRLVHREFDVPGM